MLRWPGACADFPAKSNYDIIEASSGDVPMTWGVLDDDIHVIRYDWAQGIKGWMQGGKGFPVLRFWFLVVHFEGVELIGLI